MEIFSAVLLGFFLFAGLLGAVVLFFFVPLTVRFEISGKDATFKFSRFRVSYRFKDRFIFLYLGKLRVRLPGSPEYRPGKKEKRGLEVSDLRKVSRVLSELFSGFEVEASYGFANPAHTGFATAVLYSTAGILQGFLPLSVRFKPVFGLRTSRYNVKLRAETTLFRLMSAIVKMKTYQHS